MATGLLAYELSKFDDIKFKATARGWRRQIANHPNEILANEYERLLLWAETHIDYSPKCDTFAYGIFDETNSAAAIVEIIYSKSGRKWLKLLNLTLSPSLDLGFLDHTPDTAKYAQIYSAALVGTFSLTRKDHPASQTKLYARSGTLLAFFKGIMAIFNETKMPNIKASIEGRWLVLRARG